MAKMDKGVLTGKPVTYPIPSPAGGVQMETFIPWTLVKRGIRREIITSLDAPQAFTLEAAQERRKRKAAQNTPLIHALGLLRPSPVSATEVAVQTEPCRPSQGRQEPIDRLLIGIAQSEEPITDDAAFAAVVEDSSTKSKCSVWKDALSELPSGAAPQDASQIGPSAMSEHRRQHAYPCRDRPPGTHR
jgi:hypothetical protein